MENADLHVLIKQTIKSLAATIYILSLFLVLLNLQSFEAKAQDFILEKHMNSIQSFVGCVGGEFDMNAIKTMEYGDESIPYLLNKIENSGNVFIHSRSGDEYIYVPAISYCILRISTI